MLAGAVVGAVIVLHVSPTAALGLATGLVAILACAAVVATRRHAAWQPCFTAAEGSPIVGQLGTRAIMRLALGGTRRDLLLAW